MSEWVRCKRCGRPVLLNEISQCYDTENNEYAEIGFGRCDLCKKQEKKQLNEEKLPKVKV